jgi:excisionase family DNA binding protein
MSSIDTTGPFLTLREAAKQLSLSYEVLRQEAQDGRIAHIRLGTGRGRYRFTTQQLQDYVESRVKADRKPTTKWPEPKQYL